MIKLFNELFHKKLEFIRYNAALATTSAIQRTNTVKWSRIKIRLFTK